LFDIAPALEAAHGIEIVDVVEGAGDADERADVVLIFLIDEFMAEFIDLDPALDMSAIDHVEMSSGFCVFG